MKQKVLVNPKAEKAHLQSSFRWTQIHQLAELQSLTSTIVSLLDVLNVEGNDKILKLLSIFYSASKTPLGGQTRAERSPLMPKPKCKFMLQSECKRPISLESDWTWRTLKGFGRTRSFEHVQLRSLTWITTLAFTIMQWNSTKGAKNTNERTFTVKGRRTQSL